MVRRWIEQNKTATSLLIYIFPYLSLRRDFERLNEGKSKWDGEVAVDRITEKEVNSLVPIYTPGLPKNMKGPGQPARAKASVTNPKNAVCAAGYQGQGSNTDRSIRSSSL